MAEVKEAFESAAWVHRIVVVSPDISAVWCFTKSFSVLLFDIFALQLLERSEQYLLGCLQRHVHVFALLACIDSESTDYHSFTGLYLHELLLSWNLNPDRRHLFLTSPKTVADHELVWS